MLDSVLSQAEEIRARDRVGVHAIADMICGAHDNRPRAGRCARYNGLFRLVISDNLEVGASVAVENLAMIHDL